MKTNCNFYSKSPSELLCKMWKSIWRSHDVTQECNKCSDALIAKFKTTGSTKRGYDGANWHYEHKSTKIWKHLGSNKTLTFYIVVTERQSVEKSHFDVTVKWICPILWGSANDLEIDHINFTQESQTGGHLRVIIIFIMWRLKCITFWSPLWLWHLWQG